MIRIHLRITWPALILILIALLAYLARDPGQRQPAPARVPSHGRPACPRPPLHRTPARERDGSDYDGTTRRLDEEAAAAGQPVFDEIIIDMPQPSWRNKE